MDVKARGRRWSGIGAMVLGLAASGCGPKDAGQSSGTDSGASVGPGTVSVGTSVTATDGSGPTSASDSGSGTSGPSTASTGATTSGTGGSSGGSSGASTGSGDTGGTSAGTTGPGVCSGLWTGGGLSPDVSPLAGTGSGSTTGAVFIPDPDGGVGSIECDIWAQDCAQGEKCNAWANDGGNSWNATKCVPVDPNPNQPGDPCSVTGNGVSGVDDCAKGAMCWNVDTQTNMGTCVGLCTGSEANPVCPAGTDCTISNDGVLILCLPGCDPLLQNCDANQVCVPTPGGEGFSCVLDASDDAGTAGDPCEYVNVCKPGLFCAAADAVAGCMGAQGCCTPFCDVNDPCTCPGAPANQCVPWYAMGQAPPGLDHVGACIKP